MEPAILLVAIITLTSHIYLVRNSRRLARKLAHTAAAVDQLPSFFWSTSTVHHSLSSEHPLPNWGHWAIPPDLLTIAMRIITDKQPKLVVEFGSGISTVIVASLLRNHGGRLVSVEHDAKYAKLQQHNIQCRELDTIVDLRIAPISNEKHPPFEHPWYSSNAIDDLENVDLVIVDGPPRSYGAEVRYPGIAKMLNKLSPGGTIILDDAARPGEQNIKQSLLKQYPEIVIVEPPTMRGCLIIQKRQ
jgi:predicted O-methyltransferase YrrM